MGDQAGNDAGLPLPNVDTGPVGPGSAPASEPQPAPQPGGGLPGLYGELLDPNATTDVTTGGMADLMLAPLARGLGSPPPPPPAGHGFRFDAEGVEEITRELQAVLDEELRDAERVARKLTQILPPGDEDASHTMARIANQAGENYNEFLTGVVNRIKAIIQAIQATTRAKAAEDEDVQATMDKGLTD
ncbi:MAG: hypothetical protein ACRDQW_00165 [Haloechinothrix sp.]